MPGEFGITYGDVERFADSLRAQNTVLNGVVQDMKSTAASRFADWQAQSELAYTNAAAIWQNQADVMHDDLENDIKELHRKMDHYRRTDHNLATGI
jgi:uncharacterized protein YukE